MLYFYHSKSYKAFIKKYIYGSHSLTTDINKILENVFLKYSHNTFLLCYSFLKISLILTIVSLHLQTFTAVFYAFSIKKTLCHNANILQNKQTIPTQTFLVTFVPQSFTLLPVSMKHVLILASRVALHSSSILAGDKSKVTK